MTLGITAFHLGESQTESIHQRLLQYVVVERVKNVGKWTRSDLMVAGRLDKSPSDSGLK